MQQARRILVLLLPILLIGNVVQTRSQSMSTIYLPTLLSGKARPNILIILTDDQRADTMDYMPRTKARVFDEGITFSNAFVTTPLCCPSRASILTGMYAHHHGVRTNLNALLQPTLADHLQRNGYFTGLVGKYLNSWNGTPRPEFDVWMGSLYPDGTYFNPQMNVNGSWRQVDGYATSVLEDHALQFLKMAAKQDKPFFLLFAPPNPHEPADPAPGDEHLYTDLAPHRPPSFNEDDTRDKPGWLRARPKLTGAQIAALDTLRRRQLQSLASLDRSVDQLLTTLERQGELNNTMVIYLSDNGFLWGEHRWISKAVVYDESVRIPMAIRYPPLIPVPRRENRLVANIDLAPTFYDLAGVPIPEEVDGRSLVPLLQGTPEWRDELLLEGGFDRSDVFYAAIQTERYLYNEIERYQPELYDLTKDPYQLTNVATAPAYAAVRADLQERLARARKKEPGWVHVRAATEGVPSVPYTFKATVRPLTTTLPLTYRWEAAGLPAITHVSGITDTVTFTWPSAGMKLVRVTVTTREGDIVGTRVLPLLGVAGLRGDTTDDFVPVAPETPAPSADESSPDDRSCCPARTLPGTFP